MSRAWRWYVIGYLVTLPLTIAALLYAPFVGARSFRWQDGCLTFLADRMVGRPGGQCWSPVIGFANEQERERRDLQAHERCHVVQAMVTQTAAPLLVFVWLLVDLPWARSLWGVPWLGVLPIALDVLWCLVSVAPFAFVYGWLFGRYYATEQKDEQPGWHDDYRRNPLESWAYARQAAYLAMPPIKQIHVWGHRS